MMDARELLGMSLLELRETMGALSTSIGLEQMTEERLQDLREKRTRIVVKRRKSKDDGRASGKS